MCYAASRGAPLRSHWHKSIHGCSGRHLEGRLPDGLLGRRPGIGIVAVRWCWPATGRESRSFLWMNGGGN
jgi:hypothetical protein